MDSAQFWITALGAGGLGSFLIAAAKYTAQWLNGSAGREKARNADLKEQRDSAVTRADRLQEAADREARRRRLAQEHAGQLRHMLLEHGVPPDELPPWPTEHPSQFPPRT